MIWSSNVALAQTYFDVGFQIKLNSHKVETNANVRMLKWMILGISIILSDKRKNS